MSLKSWTACIVSTLLAVALTSYLLADEQTEREPVNQQTEEAYESPQNKRPEYMRKLQDAKQLMDNGQYAEAIEPLQKLLSVASDPTVMLELGRCFAELKEHDIALQYYSLAMSQPASVDGLLVDANLERGNLYLKLGRFREAHDDFSHGVTLAPLNPQMLYGRGLAQLELARRLPHESVRNESMLTSAIASFDRTIQIDEGHALAYYGRGMAKAMLGQEDGAREDLARAVQVDDKHELAQRLANLTVDLMHENGELNRKLSALEAEAAEVAKAGDEFKGQVGEMVDTLRQIRDLLAAPRGRLSIGTTGAGDSNKGAREEAGFVPRPRFRF
jgi:tetratricopeptide (TPR) repeat protein